MSLLPPKADIRVDDQDVPLGAISGRSASQHGRLFDHLSNESSVVGMSRPQQSRMWTPRRGCQQLDLLCHDKRPELRGKAFHEVLVGEDPCPVLPPVGVVIKLPEMDDLVDRASVGLEVAYELLVMAALLERPEAVLLVELRRFRHLTDVQCVRSQFVQRQCPFTPKSGHRAVRG
jgi:hypothetical protein